MSKNLNLKDRLCVAGLRSLVQGQKLFKKHMETCEECRTWHNTNHKTAQTKHQQNEVTKNQLQSSNMDPKEGV